VNEGTIDCFLDLREDWVVEDSALAPYFYDSTNFLLNIDGGSTIGIRSCLGNDLGLISELNVVVEVKGAYWAKRVDELDPLPSFRLLNDFCWSLSVIGYER
jgi:hypothetical protein